MSEVQTAHTHSAPLVGVLMGSSSDWDVMKNAVAILQEFGVPYEAKVVSAHRMPDEMFAYAESARERGIRAIIAARAARRICRACSRRRRRYPCWACPSRASI